MTWNPAWTAAAIFVADLLIRIGLSARVIMRRRPVGVSLAWLAVILMVPFLGAFIYLFLGERRLGTSRATRWAAFRQPFEAWIEDLQPRAMTDWSSQGAECEPLARLASSVVGIPPLVDNNLHLLTSASAVFESLLADIESATSTCHLEFYIWALGGHGDEVARALIRAAARGVTCRVLVDAVGSKTFLASSLAREMQTGGVRIQPALPTGLFRSLFVRLDLRLHRKIVVIDGKVAYTGSLNLVDPRYFKQDSGVGQWVDAMVRVRGPAVEALAVTLLSDWELETQDGIDHLRQTGDVSPQPAAGNAAIQVLPSGPREQLLGIQQILLTTIYAARRELILTTPYFVPDESMLNALIAAARRGVDVTLIVPERVDSLLVRMASAAHSGDLAESGVRVCEFTEGLLHTKSVTVDGEFSLFGSLNLDPRSLFLNFEITLAVYDREFCRTLRALQQSYIDGCRPFDLENWHARPWPHRLAANAARLVSPLL